MLALAALASVACAVPVPPAAAQTRPVQRSIELPVLDAREAGGDVDIVADNIPAVALVYAAFAADGLKLQPGAVVRVPRTCLH